MKRKAPPGGYHPYTPPARTAEDDRCLLNWMSTRVTPDGLDCAPDSEYERALVENRLAYAKALGLQVRPGVYLALGVCSCRRRRSRSSSSQTFWRCVTGSVPAERTDEHTGGGWFDLHIRPPVLCVLTASG